MAPVRDTAAYILGEKGVRGGVGAAVDDDRMGVGAWRILKPALLLLLYSCAPLRDGGAFEAGEKAGMCDADGDDDDDDEGVEVLVVVVLERAELGFLAELRRKRWRGLVGVTRRSLRRLNGRQVM